MNQFLPESKYFSTQEVASLLKINVSSVRNWIKRHPDFEEKYVVRRSHQGGRGGIMILVHEDGIPVIMATKQSFRGGGASSAEKAVTALSQTFPSKLAEHAVEQAHIEQSTDPLIRSALREIELRKAQLAQQAQLDDLGNKVAKLYSDKEQATQELLALPESPDKPKELTIRAMLRERVNAFAKAKDVAYPEVWGRLYKELYYRYQFNAKSISEHRNISQLDALDQEGLLKEAFDLSCELFKI